VSLSPPISTYFSHWQIGTLPITRHDISLVFAFVRRIFTSSCLGGSIKNPSSARPSFPLHGVTRNAIELSTAPGDLNIEAKFLRPRIGPGEIKVFFLLFFGLREFLFAPIRIQLLGRAQRNISRILEMLVSRLNSREEEKS
jgi:hypothetical protein